jgi:hypothetical membrane protein
VVPDISVKWLRYAGPAAVVWAWVVVAVSAAANPAYSVLRGPLSALGSPGAVDPWIYNVGLMSVGALILLYALSLAAMSRHWMEGFAAGFFGVAGVFLALVGIYHGGTYPHDFVSLWFFMQSALAAVAWGIGELLWGSPRGLIFIALGIGAPMLAFLLPWPSNGVEECFGALAVDAYALLVFVEGRRAAGSGPGSNVRSAMTVGN